VGNRFVAAGDCVVVGDPWLDSGTRATLVLPDGREVWRLDLEHVLYIEVVRPGGLGPASEDFAKRHEVALVRLNDPADGRARAIADLKAGLGELRRRAS
jgi:hypothetical protein